MSVRVRDQLAERVAGMPLLDHHAHPPLDLPQRIDAAALRAPFTESRDRGVWVEDVPWTTGYRAMIRWLAALLEVAPEESAVLAARAGMERERYHRLLADDAGLGTLLADHLFAEEQSLAPEAWARLTGREVRRLTRIEVVAERLLPAATSWEGFRQAFARALAAAHGEGAVGFKSIAAYRAGLAVERVDAATASAAFERARAEIEAGTFTRLEQKPLVDALVWEALEVAAELSLPVQFHVGLGDDDAVMPLNNPTLLRDIFRESRYAHVPIVLLHCYPYVREAAYLASIYPNAYLDLGLTVPLAGSHCRALIEEALGLAPLNKILASTDGHGVPEFQWFAARLWRAALPAALASVVEQGMLDVDEAALVASMILSGNSERIYPL